MSKETIVSQVKVWITPSLIGILGMFIWRDLSELRSDVKTLLSQSAEDQVKIQSIEKDVEVLKIRIWEYRNGQSQNNSNNNGSTLSARMYEAIRQDDLLNLKLYGNKKRG